MNIEHLTKNIKSIKEYFSNNLYKVLKIQVEKNAIHFIGDIKHDTKQTIILAYMKYEGTYGLKIYISMKYSLKQKLDLEEFIYSLSRIEQIKKILL